MPHNPNTAGTAQRTSSRFSRAPNPANEVNLLWESERTRKLPKRRNTSEAKPCRLQSRSMSCHNKLLSGSGKECPHCPHTNAIPQKHTNAQHPRSTTLPLAHPQCSPRRSTQAPSSAPQSLKAWYRPYRLPNPQCNQAVAVFKNVTLLSSTRSATEVNAVGQETSCDRWHVGTSVRNTSLNDEMSCHVRTWMANCDVRAEL